MKKMKLVYPEGTVTLFSDGGFDGEYYIGDIVLTGANENGTGISVHIVTGMEDSEESFLHLFDYEESEYDDLFSLHLVSGMTDILYNNRNSYDDLYDRFTMGDELEKLFGIESSRETDHIKRNELFEKIRKEYSYPTEDTRNNMGNVTQLFTVMESFKIKSKLHTYLLSPEFSEKIINKYDEYAKARKLISIHNIYWLGRRLKLQNEFTDIKNDEYKVYISLNEDNAPKYYNSGTYTRIESYYKYLKGPYSMSDHYLEKLNIYLTYREKEVIKLLVSDPESIYSKSLEELEKELQNIYI